VPEPDRSSEPNGGHPEREGTVDHGASAKRKASGLYWHDTGDDDDGGGGDSGGGGGDALYDTFVPTAEDIAGEWKVKITFVDVELDEAVLDKQYDAKVAGVSTTSPVRCWARVCACACV
jgi:hypothetical protein